MEIKIKRKTKTILFSTMLICLIILSFSLTTQAAADPTMTVDFNSSYTPECFPIKIDVNFVWDYDSINRQKLRSIFIYYTINKLLINEETCLDEETYLSYERKYTDVPRPAVMTFTIPSAGLVPGDNLRFKVEVIWINYVLKESPLSSGPHLIRILDEAGKGELQLGLIIGISAGSLVAVLIVFLYFWRRRRR